MQDVRNPKIVSSILTGDSFVYPGWMDPGYLFWTTPEFAKRRFKHLHPPMLRKGNPSCPCAHSGELMDLHKHYVHCRRCCGSSWRGKQRHIKDVWHAKVLLNAAGQVWRLRTHLWLIIRCFHLICPALTLEAPHNLYALYHYTLLSAACR